MRKDVVKLLELFVFKKEIPISAKFSSKKWETIYKKNSFSQSDHILNFALKAKTEFFLWDHLSCTRTEKIVYEARCHHNRVNRGFTTIYETNGYKIICMFSIHLLDDDLEEYICQNRDFFKELINNIKYFYVKSDPNELWKNISRTY